MTEPSEHSIRLAFPFTLLDRIWAGLVMIPQRPAMIVIHSVFPIVGILFAALLLSRGRALGPVDIVIVVACLLFTPLMILIAVPLAYITNPTIREPFTYTFDDRGIHVNAVTHEFTHHWSAIPRVKRSAGFMLFFFGPATAHCIPLKIIRRENVEQALIDLARRNGAKIQS